MIAPWKFLVPIVLFSASSAARQVTPSPTSTTEPIVCVSVGINWNGDLADIRDIESKPVPESFRRRLESNHWCERWQLIQDSLIDWHFAFGSERSTTAALAYLERNSLRYIPAPESYSSELDRARRAARPDMRRAAAMAQPSRQQYLETRPRYRRLSELLSFQREYLFLAEQYLRAAEEFGSSALLAKAVQYLDPSAEPLRFRDRLGEDESNPREAIRDTEDVQRIDFAMRSAILRAHLSESPAGQLPAQEIVRAYDRPIYRQFAENAFSGGEGFCDISSGASEAEELQSACNADSEIEDMVVAYWTNRAALHLVTGEVDEWNDEFAVRLLEKEMAGNEGRCCRRRSSEDLLRLRLMRADYHRRMITHLSSDDSDAEDHWGEALRELERAMTFAPTADAPQRFRRIAETWLRIWRQGETLGRIGDRQPPTASPHLRRFATYLRRVVADLDSIATGANAGLALPSSGSP